MKKVLAIAILSVIGIIGLSSAPTPAEAQLVLCNVCCSNATGLPVCSGLVMQCGAVCSCAGFYGYGHAC